MDVLQVLTIKKKSTQPNEKTRRQLKMIAKSISNHGAVIHVKTSVVAVLFFFLVDELRHFMIH